MAFEPESTETAGAASASALPAAILGANLWAVTVALPLAMSRPVGWLSAAALLAGPLVPLAAGASTHGRRPTATRWLLLAVFPASVAVAAALLPGLGSEPFTSPFGTVLGALSLVAYGAHAAWLLDRPCHFVPCTFQPLYGITESPEAVVRARRRRLLLAVGGAGAATLAVLIPSLSEPAAMAHAWGDGARSGAVLLSVVAGSLGVIAITRFVGPATRLVRAPLPTPRASAWRAAALTALALVGAGAYLALRAR